MINDICPHAHLMLVGWETIEGDNLYVAQQIYGCVDCGAEVKGRKLQLGEFSEQFMSSYWHDSGNDKPADFSAGWEV